MPKYPPLTVEILAPMGEDGEYVDYKTLTPKQQQYVKDKIFEKAEIGLNEYIANLALSS